MFSSFKSEMDKVRITSFHYFSYPYVWYRILPNKGTRGVSKAASGILRRKLRFRAFQRRFRIENRTIVKETAHILNIYDRIGFH